MSVTTCKPTGCRPFAEFRSLLEHPTDARRNCLVGRLSAVESTDAFTVLMDVPGCSDSDVSITLTDGLLTISGERSLRVPEGAREIYNDRDRGQFQRVLKLREPVDRGAIEAMIEHGVLKIRLPRIPDVLPVKIPIRAVERPAQESTVSAPEQSGCCSA